MALIVVGHLRHFFISVLQIEGWGLPVEGFEAGSEGAIFPRVIFPCGEQTPADPFAPLGRLNEENIYEKPMEMDLATKSTEHIAFAVLRVEPNVLAFWVLTNNPIVELAEAPPKSDGSYFLSEAMAMVTVDTAG